MKIICVKLQCPICHIAGSAQLFLNNRNEIRYSRVRQYKGLNEFKKPRFEYHKVEDLEALKTSLKTKGVSLPIVKADNGQIGKGQKVNNVDPKLGVSGLNFGLGV